MEQPTARRRRHSSGAESVSVADLLAKTGPDGRTGTSHAQDGRAGDAGTPIDGSDWATMPAREEPPPSTELVRYDDAVEEQDSTHRLSRTIVGTLIAMVLCGVVTAAAVVAGDPPPRRTPSPPALQPAVTAGPAVVRPLAMIDQLVSGGLDDIPGAAPAAPAGGDPGPLAGRAEAERVVTDFYEQLPLRKEEAYQRLGPVLQNDDPANPDDGLTSFEGSWRGTRQVNVRVLPPRPEDGGLVRAAVSAEQFDGSVLVLIELVEVRSSQIVDVRLLSAHQG